MQRVLKAFFPAVILAFVLASVLFTQFNLANLQAMGQEVSMGVRIATTFDDLIGMASSYLLLILVAFLLGLPVAAGLNRLAPGHRALLFTLAGFTAIIALHLIMKAALGISAIAVTRTLPGLLGQGLAGAAGGYCYHHLSRPA
jgi:hypothetical protein